MSENVKMSQKWNWFYLLIFFFVVGILGFLGRIAAPVFRWTGESKQNYIIDNLRFIDGAKSEWAIEHGITNDAQIMQLSNPPTEQDLIPYMGGGYFLHPIAGEIYIINPMNLPPVAKLTRKVGTWPKDAVFWLPYNLNPAGQLIFTNGTN